MENIELNHITCNTDDNYAQHCCAMLCSLFENNKESVFHIHILTHGLSDVYTTQIKLLCNRYNNKLTIYDVDESKLEGVKFRKKRPLTKAAYYRILLPEILEDKIKKVLYLDCDMIIMGNIEELFELELDNYALAATLDSMPWNSTHRKQLKMESDERSFCSGIMMINLAYWRSNNVVERLLEFSKRDRHPVFLHDQDALNYVFMKQWFLLPPKWNKASESYLPDISGLPYFDIYEYVYQPKVIHFSTNAKPWFNIKCPYSHYYRKYLNLSGFVNPVFVNISWKKKKTFYAQFFRYYIRKYVIPFLPSTLLLLVKDIVKILKLFTIVTNREKRRNYILKESLNNLQ